MKRLEYIQNRSISLVLVVLMFVFYWVPLLVWMGRSWLGESIQIGNVLPFWRLVFRTLGYSSLAAAGALAAAYPVALLWRFSAPLVRNGITGCMLFPMIVGLLARNYSWIGMMSSSQESFPISGQKILYTPLSVALVMTSIFVPYAYFLLLQGFSAVRYSFIDAARTLGAPDWKTFVWVVVPLSFRAALLSFGLILSMAVGYFVTPNMIGGGKTDFISNAVLQHINYGHFGNASAVAFKFTAVMLLPILTVGIMALRRRILVTGR